MELLEFPNSKTTVGTIHGVPAFSLELRFHINRENDKDWDTPVFPWEVRAVELWEERWSEKYLSGHSMAKWDAKYIRDVAWVVIFHGPKPDSISNSSISGSGSSISDSGTGSRSPSTTRLEDVRRFSEGGPLS